MNLRVSQAAASALIIAKKLESHEKVERVIYPGLLSHPDHQAALNNRANDSLSGGSGVLAFYINGGIEETHKFLMSLKLCTLAVGLGGVETLIEAPGCMSHKSVPSETRKELGIYDNFVRLSVGLEETEDILNDLM